MVYPTSGSNLSGRISTGLSTQIIVKVNNETVGAIQQLSINHNRNLYRVPELGLDGFLEVVPNNPTTYDISVNRIVFDRLRLPEAFSRGFVNIKSQLIPFDILIIDRSNGDGEGAVVTTLSRNWFKSYSVKYGADNYIITEDAGLVCEDIYTTLGSSNQSAATGGDRGLNFDRNAREQDTDRGGGGVNGGSGFRGTLDVENLMNQVFEG